MRKWINKLESAETAKCDLVKVGRTRDDTPYFDRIALFLSHTFCTSFCTLSHFANHNAVLINEQIH